MNHKSDCNVLLNVSCTPYKQSGVALLYILLIFSLITSIASHIVTNLWQHTVKNARYLERVQARQYALGAENYIAFLLDQDFVQDKKNKRMVDHEYEIWNVKTVSYSIDEGTIEVQVIDEQSKFNLNWLAETDRNDSIDNEPTYQESGRFSYINMLKQLLLTQSLDQQLAYKIKDWVDSDTEPSENGAEDDVYLALDTPRRTPNSQMASISELILIQDIAQEDLMKLIPLVTVLPKNSKINLNTTIPEIIHSISPSIAEGDALAIVEGRGKNGISSMQELNNSPMLNGKTGAFLNTPIAFNSLYFSAYIKATFRETTFYMRTLLFRNSEGQVQVAGREIGPNNYWTPTKKES